MKLQAVCLCVLVLVAASCAHNLPYQPWGKAQQGDKGEELPPSAYQQQDGGEGERGRFGENWREPTKQDASDGDGDEEDDEGRKVYLMYMKAETSEEEEPIGGQFYEGPIESFVDMEEVPLQMKDEGDEGDPESPLLEQHHHLVGKREAAAKEDSDLSDLEVYLQRDREEGGGGGDEVVTVQWSNKIHALLNVRCPAGFGLYRMRSIFYTASKDRLFLFTCKRVAPVCMKKANYDPSKRVCKWLKGNNLRASGGYHCAANYYLAGVWSKYTCVGDREWWGLCCNTPRLCTTGCSWTGYLNNYRGAVGYSTVRVFGGMTTIFSSSHKDRRFRVSTCALKAC